MKTPLRGGALALAALILCLAAGCGGDDDDGAGGGGATGTAATESAFPVTVEHKLGKAEIPEEPKRIVTLDFPSTDAVLALGHKPVAMYEVTYVEGGVQEWTKRKLEELGGEPPELLNTDKGFPLEKLASLRPDLIVGTNTYPLVADSYDKLSAIAPVVAHVGAPGVDSWQDGLETIGKALGKPDAAARLAKDVEDRLAQEREASPEFKDKTVSLFNYAAGDAAYVINDNEDFSLKFMRELGFAGAPEAVLKAKGADGRAAISAENYDMLDADLVIGTSTDAKSLEALGKETTFKRVPAVEDGRYLAMGIGPATSIAFPSVLSIPWALEDFVPRMAATLTP